MDTCLLIIDIQNDYFPGGKMELEGSPEAALKTKKLLERFRAKEMPAVHIQHISVRPGSAFFLPETEGVQIQKDVAPLAGEKVIQKYFPNSFRDTGLDAYLKGLGIKKLVIAGMMTHMCVDTTVRAAFDLGYECVLAGDCCATRVLSFGGRDVAAADVQASYLAALGAVFAKVTASDEIQL